MFFSNAAITYLIEYVFCSVLFCLIVVYVLFYVLPCIFRTSFKCLALNELPFWPAYVHTSISKSIGYFIRRIAKQKWVIGLIRNYFLIRIFLPHSLCIVRTCVRVCVCIARKDGDFICDKVQSPFNLLRHSWHEQTSSNPQIVQ